MGPVLEFRPGADWRGQASALANLLGGAYLVQSVRNADGSLGALQLPPVRRALKGMGISVSWWADPSTFSELGCPMSGPADAAQLAARMQKAGGIAWSPEPHD